VLIGDIANCLQEECQIGGFGKACELGRILDAHIDDLLHARRVQPIEEIFRTGFGEADCKCCNVSVSSCDDDVATLTDT